MTARKPRTVAYGKTQKGQLVYDLGFTKLSERYLARKHKMPVTNIRDLRAIILAALGESSPLKRSKQ